MTIGSAIKKGKKHKLPALLKNESDRNKYSEQIEKLEEEKDWKIKNKGPQELPVGIEAFSKGYFAVHGKRRTFGKETFQSFVKMTQPTWAADDRAVVKLTAAILSAYVMRQILDNETEIDVEAVDERDIRSLYATIDRVENGMLGVRKIAESMIVSTAVDDGRFEFSVPEVIQTKIKGEIIEEANLSLKKCDYSWPAPYRDTAVLLDVRGFGKKDIEDFANRNPWCTCILYGKKFELPFGYQISIKGTAFSDLESTWDVRKVYELVEAYVAHVPELFEGEQSPFQRTWVQAGDLIQRYIDARHKLNGAERFKTKVLLASTLAFLDFTQAVCGVAEDEMQPFREGIIALFLPGGFKKETKQRMVKEKPQDVFENVLKKILTAENLKHFYRMPGERGEVWPERQANGTEVWGYIRSYAWQEGGEEEPCLVLLRGTLPEIVKEVVPDMQGFKDVLIALSKENVPYIHQTDNAKIRYTEGEKSKSVKALRLRISELPIDENIRKRLLTP